MIILGADPGSKNFAISILEFNGKKLSIIGTKMIESPINKYDNTLQPQFQSFVNEVASIRNRYQPDHVIMERYQTRGNGGNTIEFVSMMNALLFYTMRKSNPEMVTASTWKNACTRAGFNLNDIYAEYRMTTQQFDREIHEFDASVMAVYKMYKELGAEYYSKFNVHTFIERLLEAPIL